MNRKETNNEIPLLIKLPFAEGDIRRDSEAVGRTEQTTLTRGAGGPLIGSQVIAMIRRRRGAIPISDWFGARKPAISESSRRPGISEDFELAGYVIH